MFTPWEVLFILQIRPLLMILWTADNLEMPYEIFKFEDDMDF